MFVKCKKKSTKWKPTTYELDEKKVPLIVFGDAMFGKDHVVLKGKHKSGVVDKLFKSLKGIEAEGQLIVVTIDEYKASKTCSRCFHDDIKIITSKSFKGVGVVSCKECHKLWQRDSNAANNMMTISKSIWSGEGRPLVFTPQRNQSP